MTTPPPAWPFPTWKGQPYQPAPKPVQPYPGEAPSGKNFPNHFSMRYTNHFTNR